MSLQKLMSNFADYNLWVNRQYADWLSKKPAELLNRESPSSYSSIMKTLRHMNDTEVYWYSIISETTCSPEETKDDSKVFDELLSTSEKLSKLVNSYSEEDLVKKVKIVNQWFECDLPRYEYIQHIVNHG